MNAVTTRNYFFQRGITMSKKLTPDFMKYIRETEKPEDAERIIKDFEENPEVATVASIIAEIFGFDSPFEKEEKETEDLVNHPKHYTAVSAQLEPIDVLRYAPFDLGNALKYILRAPYKGNALLDYQKARKYLEWAAESACYNRKPYETFIENYGLQLNKFEVLNGLIVHVYWDSIRNLRDYVESKIKELQK